jgi:chromatin remodeling complex protein RSC6
MRIIPQLLTTEWTIVIPDSSAYLNLRVCVYSTFQTNNYFSIWCDFSSITDHLDGLYTPVDNKTSAMTTLPVEYSRLSEDIFDLVKRTDLSLLTSKFVRNQMEEKHGVQLRDFRTQIDEIIRNSIQKINSKKSDTKPMNGDTVVSSKSESSTPPKSEIPTMDLSFDDDNDKYTAIKRRRAHTAIQRKPPAKRTKKAKESGGTKKNTAFTKVCVLSDELSAVLERKYMKRSDVVKAMWAYFREHNLMDPKDKRYALIDERMRPVFGTKRIQVIKF